MRVRLPQGLVPAAPRRAHLLALLVVCVAAGCYLLLIHDKGWIPHDEGLLAHGAERVLAGELPHRDFDAVYTGGLEYFHGAAFVLFGRKLSSLRLVLLVCSLSFVAVLYSLAARFFGPLASSALVLTAGIWSLPNYFAPLPSWYLLILAVFGLAALLRGLDAGRRRWLFLAGLCGGLSFLVKSVGGVYFGAAGVVTLLYDEQQSRGGDGGTPGRGYLFLVGLFATGLTGGLVLLVHHHLGFREAFHFVLPGAALAALLVRTEAASGAGALGDRLQELARRLAPFGAGLVAPIALFLLPYAAAGALGDFVHGVFVLPQRRLEMASVSLPPPWTLVTALPMAVLLLLPRTLAHRRVRFAALPLAALLGFVLLEADRTPVYVLFWTSVRPLLPLAVVAGCIALARRDSPLEPRGRVELVAVLAVAAFLGLNQYPYSSALYFCYAAPLVVLALAGAVRAQPRSPGRMPLLLTVLAFHALFGARWLLPGSVRDIGAAFVPRPALQPLPLKRSGLEVPPGDVSIYQTVVEEIRAHSAAGDFIYAAPDCPELYFLADRRNPTRTMYDFFDEDLKNPLARSARILDALDARQVNVVVINRRGEFSGRPSPELLKGLSRLFPKKRLIGNFTVLWRA